MVLTKEEAYKILNLVPGVKEERVLLEFKSLALDWFPYIHQLSSFSIERLQAISEAVLTLTDIPPFKVPEKPMTLEEMLSLFQLIFFGNDEVVDSEDDDVSIGSLSDDSCNDVVDVYNKLVNEGYMIKDDDLKTPQSKEESIASDKEELDEETKRKKAVENAEELIKEEERLKKKAKNKKAQKKRRKERKRLEKNELEKNKHGNTSDAAANMTQDEDDSADDIDTSSAFVAIIAKKKIGIPIPNKNSSEKDKSSESETQSRILRSHEIAMLGNKMAELGQFKESIKYFTDAIRLEPNDHRFFSNRSYCHYSLGNYEKALDDAVKSISIAPQVPKGHFRKGKALCSLEKYPEAEHCFEEVMKLDPKCDDAVKELERIKIIQITNMGFSEDQAVIALSECETVHSAVAFLLCSTAKQFDDSSEAERPFYALNGDNDFICVTTQPSSAITDSKIDPNNPEGCCSLWVGNVQPQMTMEEITKLFERYGEIISVKLMTEKFYAFINYKNKTSAGMAMLALQGRKMHGNFLKIRYANDKTTAGSTSTSTTPKPKPENKKNIVYYAPVNGDECYFWRNNGCHHGMNCKYKHIPHHKNIDQKKKSQVY